MNAFSCPQCGKTLVGTSRVAVCETCHIFMRRQKLVSEDSFEKIDTETRIEEEADNG